MDLSQNAAAGRTKGLAWITDDNFDETTLKILADEAKQVIAENHSPYQTAFSKAVLERIEQRLSTRPDNTHHS